MQGKILKSTGKEYLVKLTENQYVKASLRGRFRMQSKSFTNPIAVGDFVEVEKVKDEYVIDTILPRKNSIIRKSNKLSSKFQMLAANVDQTFLFISADSPRTPMGFINRMLVNSEWYQIPVVIVLNKIDLLSENDKARSYAQKLKRTYQNIGYSFIEISVKKNAYIYKCIELLQNKTTFLIGNSGAGKSSFVNLLSDSISQRVDEISESYDKGKHTTTVTELFELNDSTFVADTPGIKDFGLVEIPSSDLRYQMKEFLKFQNQCKFSNCVHLNEPGCMVKQAVAQEMIEADRYFSYEEMYTELS